MRPLFALALLLLAVAGCGGTTTVREDDIVVQEEQGQPEQTPAPEATPERGQRLRLAAARIAVVSHGQASDPFWAIVKKGLDDAARQTGVAVSYRAPDTYDVARMRRLIDEAISARLDGLIVSLPDVQALRAPIRRAARAGIPVVSINSGSDRFRDLGILAHVGQPEYRAGFESGRRMAAAGVAEALCVNQEAGNEGLAQRCRGFGAGMRSGGAHATELVVDLQDLDQAQRRIAQTVQDRGADGVMSLGAAAALPALEAVSVTSTGRRVRLATFDLSPEVLEAVRDRQMLFAVDQQPYLQGYLPVVLLAERSRHLLMPPRGELIPTGPDFVTPSTAEQVLELTRRGFR
jgi:simple sugar transport system substrate-binding protein